MPRLCPSVATLALAEVAEVADEGGGAAGLGRVEVAGFAGQLPCPVDRFAGICRGWGARPSPV
jgi:hypothetical protein